MMRRILKLSVLAVALAGAGAAQATLLSDLILGQSITAGDKVFDNWSLGFTLSLGTAPTFDAANIDVTALNDGGLDPGPGLAFTILNNQFQVTGDGIYSSILAEFGFRVTAPPGLGIKDVSLAVAGGTSYTTSGDNGSFVSESVGTAALLDDLGYAEAEWSYNAALVPPDIQNPTGSANFAPQSSVWVTKSVLVWATDIGETANLTGFTQRFSQQLTGPSGIPEPTSLALAALGLLGAVVGRRRKAVAA